MQRSGDECAPRPGRTCPVLAFVITHRADLDATKLCKTFRDKEDSCIKVVMRPHG